MTCYFKIHTLTEELFVIFCTHFPKRNIHLIFCQPYVPPSVLWVANIGWNIQNPLLNTPLSPIWSINLVKFIFLSCSLTSVPTLTEPSLSFIWLLSYFPNRFFSCKSFPFPTVTFSCLNWVYFPAQKAFNFPLPKRQSLEPVLFFHLHLQINDLISHISLLSFAYADFSSMKCSSSFLLARLLLIPWCQLQLSLNVCSQN